MALKFVHFRLPCQNPIGKDSGSFSLAFRWLILGVGPESFGGVDHVRGALFRKRTDKGPKRKIQGTDKGPQRKIARPQRARLVA